MNNNKMVVANSTHFNVSTEQVIRSIEQVNKLEWIGPDFDSDAVYIAIENSDYYIRPGVNKVMFLRQFEEIFTEYKRLDKGTDSHTTAKAIMTMKFIKLIKTSFDESYFKEQIARRRNHVVGNKDTLRNYLKRFDEAQLKEFIRIVILYRVNYGLFISNTSSDDMWEDFNRECRKIDQTIPSEMDLPAGKALISKDPLYFFDYLSKKDIANILCDAIDLDVSLAGSVAKKLYKCGEEATLNYLNIKLKERTSA